MATLLGLGDSGTAAAVESALSDQDEQLRAAVIPLLPRSHSPERAVVLLKPLVASASIAIQQAAWDALGQIPGDAADVLIVHGLDQLIAKRFPPEASLELVEAARKRATPVCRESLRKYEASKPAGDQVSRREAAMAGGSSSRGWDVFNRTGEMACLRCHSIGNNAVGGTVGPDLARLGSRRDRRTILESLVDPNRMIVDGYATTVLSLADGRVVSGVVVESTPTRLTLSLPDGGKVDVPVDQIEERVAGRSAMPEDIVANLPDRDLRDLVAYLSSLGSEYSSSSRLLRLQQHLPGRERPHFFRAGYR
jgi:quinoprotein glucose dehydrogenase